MLDPRYTDYAHGIDVSRWQGDIDWRSVADDEHHRTRFAFIKATEGATWTDPSFEINRLAAANAGIRAGFYHFFRATSTVEAQAKHFLQVIGGALTEGELPPVLDVEDPKQWQGLSPAQLTDMVLHWCSLVAEVRQPLIYLSPSFAESHLEPNPALANFPLWLAHWTDRDPRVPKPWSDWTFWQYSSKGRLPGITANEVDFDLFNGTCKDFQAFK